MAVLTPVELAEIRSGCAGAMAAASLAINFDKPKINAAVQAVEDWFEANRPSLSAAIDVATAPFSFTAQQKKRIVAYWLSQKFRRES